MKRNHDKLWIAESICLVQRGDIRNPRNVLTVEAFVAKLRRFFELNDDAMKRQTEREVKFVSTVVSNRSCILEDDIMCEIISDAIFYGSVVKEYDVYCYKISEAGFDMLIRRNGDDGCSRIMQNVKRVSSLHVNMVMGFAGVGGGNIYSRLTFPGQLEKYMKRFRLKYGDEKPFGKFQWEESFTSIDVTTEAEFSKCLVHIRNKWEKIGQKRNTFCYVDYELCGKFLAGEI